jgi:hypothetical protein
LRAAVLQVARRKGQLPEEIKIRSEAISRGIPIVTTQDGAYATVGAKSKKKRLQANT